MEQVSDTSTDTVETPIQRFYSGEKVFITGATGFVGRVLTEKLLRSCPNVSTLYLLIRSKKGKSVETRLQEIFDNKPLFDQLKKENPNFKEKIVIIPGHCDEGLTISEEDKNLLIKEVSIVFHAAASVRFEENLKKAITVNTKSTVDIVEMCRKMTKLKALIYVSTAFANSNRTEVRERVYPHPASQGDLIATVNDIPDNEIDQVAPRLMVDWPNSYTFSKAAAECMVKDRSEGIPVGIYRPAIITGAVREPVPGWIDNLYGSTGLLYAILMGLVRIVLGEPDERACLVPVDYTVNGLIASAWDVHVNKERRNEDLLVYNYVTPRHVAQTWRQFHIWSDTFFVKYPSAKSLWIAYAKVYRTVIMFDIIKFFYHEIPGTIMDFGLICIGKKPRFLKLYATIHKFLKALAYFSSVPRFFTDDNVVNMWNRLNRQDREIFPFDIKSINWQTYYDDYLKSIRLYVLKEDFTNLEYARRRRRIFYWLDWAVKILFILFVYWIMQKLFSVIHSIY